MTLCGSAEAWDEAFLMEDKTTVRVFLSSTFTDTKVVPPPHSPFPTTTFQAPALALPLPHHNHRCVISSDTSRWSETR